MTGFFAEQLAGRLEVVELAAEPEVAEPEVAEPEVAELEVAELLQAARARARAPVTAMGRAPLIFIDYSLSSFAGLGGQTAVGAARWSDRGRRGLVVRLWSERRRLE
jgi:hypothetical protein